MRILLTGASGFLGRRLRRELRQKSHDVFCYDITLGYNIMYPDQLENTIKNWNPDTIIHLAACLNISEAERNKKKYFQNNVKGTFNLIKCCNSSNIKSIVFSSSCSICGKPHLPPHKTSRQERLD